MIPNLTHKRPGTSASLKPFWGAHIGSSLPTSHTTMWLFCRGDKKEAESLTDTATDMALMNQLKMQGLHPSAAAPPGMQTLRGSGLFAPRSMLVLLGGCGPPLECYRLWGCFYSCFSLCWPSVVFLSHDFFPTASFNVPWLRSLYSHREVYQVEGL